MYRDHNTYQMHLQYASHIFLRSFVGCTYTIELSSGLILELQAYRSNFPHLIGIDSQKVSGCGGGNAVFNMLYLGKDFSVGGFFMKFPIARKNGNAQKIRLFKTVEDTFNDFSKTAICIFDKSSSPVLSNLKMNTEFLFVNLEKHAFIGYKHNNGNSELIPNTLFEGNTSTWDKYLDHQTIDLINNVTFINHYTQEMKVINVNYSEQDCEDIADLITQRHCRLQASGDLCTRINRYLV